MLPTMDTGTLTTLRADRHDASCQFTETAMRNTDLKGEPRQEATTSVMDGYGYAYCEYRLALMRLTSSQSFNATARAGMEPLVKSGCSLLC